MAFQIFALVPESTPAAVVFTPSIATRPTGAKTYPTITKKIVIPTAIVPRSPCSFLKKLLIVIVFHLPNI